MADTTASSDATPGAPTPGRSLLARPPRLKKRRAAEFRLKLYGILAILFAAGALVTLLSSILIQASGTLRESYITLDVPLDAEVLGVDRDSPSREIATADFDDAVKDALAARFPSAEGRSAGRDLGALVSNGASFELADRVATEPGLIGQTVEARMLTSDVVDLYLQGRFGSFSEEQVEGALTVTEDEDGLVLESTSGDFADELETVKSALLKDAGSLRAKAKRQERAVRVYTERAASAETDEDRADQEERAAKSQANFDELVAEAEGLEARAEGAGGTEEMDDENISVLVRAGGGWLRLTEIGEASARAERLTSVELPVEATQDWSLHVVPTPEADRSISDRQIVWIEELREDGAVERVWNARFFGAADSRAPELAGIWGAAVGSALTMLVTFALAFPIGVLGAIYLEEFAPKNKLTDFIEVNINNLAAVPSIVFGLLGLAVFLNVFGVPRSSPLAGGMVLALMTLPTIIIAARAAIRAVPPSIREAALGVGASNVQASFHHVLPLAMPGILTGTIIGMAQALGETAPLIMIGMVAFIVEVPSGVTDSATVLPVQIYRWSDFPEQAFEAKTAAAILVLLTFLVIMNLLAIVLRRRFERRW